MLLPVDTRESPKFFVQRSRRRVYCLISIVDRAWKELLSQDDASRFPITVAGGFARGGWLLAASDVILYDLQCFLYFPEVFHLEIEAVSHRSLFFLAESDIYFFFPLLQLDVNRIPRVNFNGGDCFLFHNFMGGQVYNFHRGGRCRGSLHVVPVRRVRFHVVYCQLLYLIHPAFFVVNRPV